MNTIKDIKQDNFSKAVVVQLILKKKHTNVALFKDMYVYSWIFFITKMIVIFKHSFL